MTDGVGARHLAACTRFTEAVRAAAGHWPNPSPCQEWSARDIVEHVIGFHDVLLLRPLGAKPHRPKDDPVTRWTVTVDALRDVFDRPGFFAGPVAVPAIGTATASQIETAPLVEMLAQDVVVHTWDLARAAGADDRLDADVCERLLARLPSDGGLERSGLFAAPVAVAASAPAQDRLLARLGRDPHWTAP